MRELVLNNFRWKLTALLLALLLWFVIRFAIYKEITGGRNQVLRDVAVMVLKKPDDARQFRIDPPHVDVIVQATTEVASDSVVVFVDLTRMPEVSTSLKQVLVRAAEGTRIVGADPAFILVERATPSESSPNK